MNNKPNSHNRQSWPPELIAKLGKASDRVLAIQFRLGRASVTDLRIQLGIKEPVPRRLKLTVAQAKLLGTCSDWDLALKWNCSETTVRNYRTKLGIPKYENEIRSKIQKLSADMGKVIDENLLKKYRVHANPVQSKRKVNSKQRPRRPKLK